MSKDRGYTAQQHMTNRLAAAYGYRIQEGVAISEFAVGDGIIILNKKGEPMMSGSIQSMEEVDGSMAVQVGGNWWPESSYSYRRL